MVKPSLEIGNNKWSIKEDNLLGYSMSDEVFVPQPITMTRGSAGTRVNSSGLVETVELLGSELANYSDNNIAFTNFSDSTTISLGSNSYRSEAFGNTNDSRPRITVNGGGIVTGKTYKVVYTPTSFTGSTVFDFWQNGVRLVNNHDASLPLTFYFDGSNSLDGFDFDGSQTFRSDYTLSVKESTKNNLARVDYDGTASSLLAEPTRTNLVTYSEVYGSGTFFSATSGSVIDNTTNTSPSGGDNATQVTSTGAGKIQSGALGLTQNTDYVLSFYAKNVDATAVGSRVYATGGSGGSNLTTVSYFSELSTTEWTRITHSFNTGTNTTIFVYLSNSLNSGGTIQLWGAQLEQGSYATSYIPNSGTALGVTRVQDQYEKAGISNLINSEEGVLFVEMAALSDDLTYRQISLSDGTSNNRLYLQYNAISNNIAAVVKVGGSTTAYTSTTLSSSNITDFNKIGFKWKLNDFALWINGVKVSVDTNGGVPTGLNEFTFNQTSSDFYGKVKQLQVFTTALTDSELETLTTI
jgi:hypothetical protein